VKKSVIISLLLITLLFLAGVALYFFRNPTYQYVYEKQEYSYLENYLYFNNSNTQLTGILWLQSIEQEGDNYKITLLNVEDKEILLPKGKTEIKNIGEDIQDLQQVYVTLNFKNTSKYLDTIVCYLSFKDTCSIKMNLSSSIINYELYPDISDKEIQKQVVDEIGNWLGKNITIENMGYFDGIFIANTGFGTEILEINLDNNDSTFIRNLYLYRKYNNKTEEDLSEYHQISSSIYAPGICEYILKDEKLFKEYELKCSIESIKESSTYNEISDIESFKNRESMEKIELINSEVIPLLLDLTSVNKEESITLASSIYSDIINDPDIYVAVLPSELPTLLYITNRLIELDNNNLEIYELGKEKISNSYSSRLELLSSYTMEEDLNSLFFSDKGDFDSKNFQFIKQYFINSNYWFDIHMGAIQKLVDNHDGTPDSLWEYYSISDLIKYLRIVETY
jgi:hypothetical protein